MKFELTSPANNNSTTYDPNHLQLPSKGTQVKLSELSVHGRTTKSLSHMLAETKEKATVLLKMSAPRAALEVVTVITAAESPLLLPLAVTAGHRVGMSEQTNERLTFLTLRQYARCPNAGTYLPPNILSSP